MRGEREGEIKGVGKSHVLRKNKRNNLSQTGKKLVQVLHTELNMNYDPLLPTLYTFQEGKGEAAPTLVPLLF